MKTESFISKPISRCRADQNDVSLHTFVLFLNYKGYLKLVQRKLTRTMQLCLQQLYIRLCFAITKKNNTNILKHSGSHYKHHTKKPGNDGMRHCIPRHTHFQIHILLQVLPETNYNSQHNVFPLKKCICSARQLKSASRSLQCHSTHCLLQCFFFLDLTYNY